MGFSLKKAIKKVTKPLAKTLGGGLIMGPLGSLLGATSGGGGGDGGADYGFMDPTLIANEERQRILDQKFEDDAAAYDQALAAAGEQAAFNERRGTENVLGGLQGRGLVRSGIALKDVVDQVLGPSLMRQNQLAAQFGLERAGRKADFLGEQRRAIQDIGRARLTQAFGERGMDLQNQIANRQAFEERRAQRRGGLMGLLGGVGGAVLGGPIGGAIGSKLFSSPALGGSSGSGPSAYSRLNLYPGQPGSFL